MQAKEELKKELTNKTQQVLALEEAKASSEERAQRLEADLAKEKEDVDKLKQITDVLKEEHVREQQKKKIAENDLALKATQIKEKDQIIAANQVEQKRLSDLNTKHQMTIEKIQGQIDDAN